MIYTHKSLLVKRRYDLEDDITAAIWLECGLPNQKKILLCAAYRQWRLVGQNDQSSPSVTEQLKRWRMFLNKWEAAAQENKEVIVLLDANMDFLTWRNSNLPSNHSSSKLKPLIDALFDQIVPLGFVQLVREATRLQKNCPKTGLDHIYTNKIEKVSSVQTVISGMSDHKIIKVTRFSKAFKQQPRYIRKRMFKNFDPSVFKSLVCAANLDEILPLGNVNLAAEMLVKKLNRVLDEIAPVKTVQLRANYVPGLQNDTKQLMVERDRLHAIAESSDSPEDWRQFRSARNMVTASIRRDKKLWEKAKLDNCKNNSDQTWKTVKSWLSWGRSGPPTQLVVDGELLSKPSVLSNTMNNFFLDKIKKLRSTIHPPKSDPLKKLKEAMKHKQCSFKLKQTNVQEVVKVIRGLKNSSSCGVDYIDTKCIKLVSTLLAPSLVHIVNLSVEASVFPDIWKIAKVVPLLKSATCDPLSPKSYRPVALLPVLSKIIEKIIFNQLTNYLESNRLIHPNLHGSRSGHNTSTALIQMYDQWVEDVEQGKLVGVLMCDQSAAYDLCDHKILLQKLSIMGVDEISISWFHSYLSNRKQHCFIDGHLSASIDLLDCGVPQGSIGGPLLWLCFTVDQPDVIHDHSVEVNNDIDSADGLANEDDNCGQFVGYVDDGAYSYAHREPNVLSSVLNDKFQAMESWMTSNKLVINPDKTHLLVLGPKSASVRRNAVQVKINDKLIVPSTSEKLLGAVVSQDLKWNQHIRGSQGSLTAQLASRINGLKRTARNANFSTRLMVANGVVLSKMVYLINLWGGSQQYLLKTLYVQQMIAARVVCGFQCHGWSNKRVLKRVGWLSVRQLIFYHTVIQAWKTLSYGIPSPLYDVLYSVHPYNTRGAVSGHIRVSQSFSGEQMSFKGRARKFFNEVPMDIRTGTLPTVKRKLKNWIMNNVPLDWA